MRLTATDYRSLTNSLNLKETNIIESYIQNIYVDDKKRFYFKFNKSKEITQSEIEENTEIIENLEIQNNFSLKKINLKKFLAKQNLISDGKNTLLINPNEGIFPCPSLKFSLTVSHICNLFRKLLKRKRVKSISQINGWGRGIVFEFHIFENSATIETDIKLMVVECFSGGNILLLNRDNIIIECTRVERDLKVFKGEVYENHIKEIKFESQIENYNIFLNKNFYFLENFSEVERPKKLEFLKKHFENNTKKNILVINDKLNRSYFSCIDFEENNLDLNFYFKDSDFLKKKNTKKVIFDSFYSLLYFNCMQILNINELVYGDKILNLKEFEIKDSSKNQCPDLEKKLKNLEIGMKLESKKTGNTRKKLTPNEIKGRINANLEKIKSQKTTISASLSLFEVLRPKIEEIFTKYQDFLRKYEFKYRDIEISAESEEIYVVEDLNLGVLVEKLKVPNLNIFILDFDLLKIDLKKYQIENNLQNFKFKNKVNQILLSESSSENETESDINSENTNLLDLKKLKKDVSFLLNGKYKNYNLSFDLNLSFTKNLKLIYKITHKLTDKIKKTEIASIKKEEDFENKKNAKNKKSGKKVVKPKKNVQSKFWFCSYIFTLIPNHLILIGKNQTLNLEIVDKHLNKDCLYSHVLDDKGPSVILKPYDFIYQSINKTLEVIFPVQGLEINALHKFEKFLSFIFGTKIEKLENKFVIEMNECFYKNSPLNISNIFDYQENDLRNILGILCNFYSNSTSSTTSLGKDVNISKKTKKFLIKKYEIYEKRQEKFEIELGIMFMENRCRCIYCRHSKSKDNTIEVIIGEQEKSTKQNFVMLEELNLPIKTEKDILGINFENFSIESDLEFYKNYLSIGNMFYNSSSSDSSPILLPMVNNVSEFLRLRFKFSDNISKILEEDNSEFFKKEENIKNIKESLNLIYRRCGKNDGGYGIFDDF